MDITPSVRDLILQHHILIIKGKKYVSPGQNPPKGVILKHGPRGGTFYIVEDKHLKLGGQHHKLFRSVGVTRDKHQEIKDHWTAAGAKSVEFIPKPNAEKNKAGKTLYNIYLNFGENTQKEIETKHIADKKKYGHPRKKPESSPEEKLRTEMGNLHPKIFFTKKFRALHPEVHHKIILATSSAAYIKYTRSVKDGHPNPISEGLTSGNIHFEVLKNHPLNQTTADDVRAEIMAEREKNKPKPIPVPDTTPVTKLKPPAFRKESDYGDQAGAEKHKKKLEQAGYEAEVRPHKSGKTTAYGVYARKKTPGPAPKQEARIPRAEKPDMVPGAKPDRKGWNREYYSYGKEGFARHLELKRQGYDVDYEHVGKHAVRVFYRNSSDTPDGVSGRTLTIHHDPMKKQAWVTKVDSYAPDFGEYGTVLVDHDKEENGTRTFTLPEDGLYRSQASGENHRNFEVIGGKIHELDSVTFRNKAKTLPQTTLEDILDRIHKDQEVRRLSLTRDPVLRDISNKVHNIPGLNTGPKFTLSGNTFEHKEWIKTLLGRVYRSETKEWDVPVPKDAKEAERLMKEFSSRGLKVQSPGIMNLEDQKPMDHVRQTKTQQTALA